MAKCGKKCGGSTQGVNRDGEIFEPSAELHTEKEHKKWYHTETMGKQRGKPRYDAKEDKKNRQKPEE